MRVVEGPLLATGAVGAMDPQGFLGIPRRPWPIKLDMKLAPTTFDLPLEMKTV